MKTELKILFRHFISYVRFYGLIETIKIWNFLIRYAKNKNKMPRISRGN
jgi:hypothetical protein